MSITPEIISGFGGAAGIGIVWAVKNLFSNRNGNGKLSKHDHDERCKLVIDPLNERLDRVDMQIDKVMNLVNDNHAETVRLILELKK